MGLSTRLLRIASKPSSIVANHVFLEYYSSDYKKWVMVDVMENFTPIFKNEPLSAFEYFSYEIRRKYMKNLVLIYTATIDGIILFGLTKTVS